MSMHWVPEKRHASVVVDGKDVLVAVALVVVVVGLRVVLAGMILFQAMNPWPWLFESPPMNIMSSSLSSALAIMMLALLETKNMCGFPLQVDRKNSSVSE